VRGRGVRVLVIINILYCLPLGFFSVTPLCTRVLLLIACELDQDDLIVKFLSIRPARAAPREGPKPPLPQAITVFIKKMNIFNKKCILYYELL
jgi:hypothetical protein